MSENIISETSYEQKKTAVWTQLLKKKDDIPLLLYFNRNIQENCPIFINIQLTYFVFFMKIC